MAEEPGPGRSGVTSLSLLHRLKARDEAAWARFVNLYGPLVRSWVRGFGPTGADADDVYQEVMAALSRSVAGFERPAERTGAFRAWLKTITRNCARDHFRRARTTPTPVGGAESLAEIPDEPEEADASAREGGEVLARALELVRAEFAESTAQAFVEVALRGRLPADVAADLGLTAFAVRQANYRVRKRLREEFADLLD